MITPSEKWLAVGGSVFFGLLILLGLGFWLRHGEAVYFNRIIAPLAGCL